MRHGGTVQLLRAFHRLQGIAVGAGLSMPVVAIITTIAMLMTVAGVSLLGTARQADDIDNQRTARTIANSIARDLRELGALVEDNAYWDEPAKAFYLGGDARSFGRETYFDTVMARAQYDSVAVIDASGTVILTVTPDGVSSGSATQDWLRDASKLALTLDDKRVTASSMAADGSDLRMIGASLIRPTSAALTRQLADTPPVTLVFSRIFSSDQLRQLGREMLVSDLAFAPAQTPGGVALRNIDGQSLQTLDWQPTEPGTAALWEAVPFLLAASFAVCFAICLLLAASIRTVHILNDGAMVDALSTLPNRRAFRQFIRRALQQQIDIAVAFIDLDGFKSVNDSFGHAVGDALIRQCATVVKDLVPDGGIAVRLGGDEFALVAGGPAADDQIVAAIDRLLQRLHKPFHIGERTISIGASVGLASTTLSARDESELMRQADIAMYVAKRSGKMRFIWFSHDMDRQQARARSIEGHLKKALDSGEFDVHYQPIVDASSGAVVAVEALLRWHSPDLDIGPDEFVPVAEETGLIDRLGEFALRRACTDAAGWPDIRLSVNISPTQLRNPDLPDRLQAVLAATGFPPHRLELEVTETYVVQEPAVAGRVLAAISALGVRIALDDFGTGYASIGFLRQFAFDTLKLDRSLVEEASRSAGARALVQASVAVARALDMRVVAEGIESDAHAISLRAVGCDYLQGWHFSRALDAAAMTMFLDRHKVGNALAMNDDAGRATA